MPNITLDPNYDPRHQSLPDMPAEIIQLRQKEKRKKIFIYLGIALAMLAIIGGIVFLLLKKSSKYHYLMLQSTYTAAQNDAEPGADIQGIEIDIQGLKFYPDKIIASTFAKADILLASPSNNIKNTSYVSLGDKKNYLIIKTKTDLKDANLKSITIYEYSLGSLNEAYNIYASNSKDGPWEFLKSGAGSTIYTP